MATTIRYSNYPMGFDVSGRRYGNNPTTGSQPRFPAHARSMDSAPMGSRPIKVFEPDGKSYWALNHSGAWRTLEQYRDAGGKSHWRMSGSFINNPICWVSS
jgi:hypothetical protein